MDAKASAVAYYHRRFGIRVGHCGSCPAEVFWLRHHVTGKRSPIDVSPSKDGTIRIIGRTHTWEVTAVPVSEQDPYRHVSHFATCPAAQRHRRPRSTAGKTHD